MVLCAVDSVEDVCSDVCLPEEAVLPRGRGVSLQPEEKMMAVMRKMAIREIRNFFIEARVPFAKE